MKILFVAHRVPFPPDKGDRIRTYNVLRYLAGRAEVDLVALADEPVTARIESELASLCNRVELIPIGGVSRKANIAKSLLAGRTASEGAFWSPRAAATISEWTHATGFRGAVLSSSALFRYIDSLRNKPGRVVVDMMDVDSEKWLDYASKTRFPRSWLYGLEGLRLRKVEIDVATQADAVTFVSEAEVDLFGTFCPHGSVHAIPNGVDVDYFRPQTSEHRYDCVFLGALDYLPNVEGVVWFCKTVWPLVRKRLPTASIAIVGRRPTAEVKALSAIPGVYVVGEVDDVRPYVASAHISVVPLQIARGIQNKILESLAMEKAVISSPPPLSGLLARPGEHLLSADSPPQWADTIESLLGDPERRNRLGTAGRSYVLEHHCWAKRLEPFASLLGLTSGDDDSLAASVMEKEIGG